MIRDETRRALFVSEYLKDFNGSRAARAIGCTAESAHQRAWELLRDEEIKKQINEKVHARLESLEIDSGLVLRELAAIGYANMMDYIHVQADGTAYVDLSTLTREQAAALSEINTEEYIEGKGEDGRTIRKVRVKFHDKKGALDLLGKYLKLWTDKMELGGMNGNPIQFAVTFAEPPAD